jgi:hypothetical protein
MNEIETVRQVFDLTKNHQEVQVPIPQRPLQSEKFSDIQHFFFISNSETTTATFSDTNERSSVNISPARQNLAAHQ